MSVLLYIKNPYYLFNLDTNIIILHVKDDYKCQLKQKVLGSEEKSVLRQFKNNYRKLLLILVFLY